MPLSYIKYKFTEKKGCVSSENEWISPQDLISI